MVQNVYVFIGAIKRLMNPKIISFSGMTITVVLFFASGHMAADHTVSSMDKFYVHRGSLTYTCR